MAQASYAPRCADGSCAAGFDGPERAGGSGGAGLSPADAAAARRLLARLAGKHPAGIALSALHRLFKRHGIRRLPAEASREERPKKTFKAYAVGYFHVDFAEVCTEEGRLYLFVAIDRTSKLAFAQLHPQATAERAADFWRRVVAAVPYRITTVLTGNGVQVAYLPHRQRAEPHRFAAVCAANGIEHRRTHPAHPWTNGQVERLNRTLKEATVRRYHYADEAALNTHLKTFLRAYNGGKRLKKLRGRTPYECVCDQYRQNPAIFSRDPIHDLTGLYR